jgi:hypothetical protein
MTSERGRLVLGLLVALAVAACAVQRGGFPERHRWWSGRGPVLPHDTFPAACGTCHEGRGWQSLHPDFEFDHEAETGVALAGAHARAQCLRCHNDRGPVKVFTDQGCAGCHEDLLQGQLGPDCTDCHTETSWEAVGQIEAHYRTRFPLVGVHAVTQCYRCHIGAEVGRFTPTSNECATCHQDDLARALNPNHVALGWVQDCDDCHIPTTWEQAEL